jgi:hypothetical protein
MSYRQSEQTFDNDKLTLTLQISNESISSFEQVIELNP